MSQALARHPHCDPRVLHRPGQCEYCDMYPERQKMRIYAGVAFTGERGLNLRPCPADEARGFGQAHEWPGNAPRPATVATGMTVVFDDPRWWVRAWRWFVRRVLRRRSRGMAVVTKVGHETNTLSVRP